ncbi:hypothetical protein PR202_gb16674 [Eleusine coracana subsp. coracana]|uniref:Uncharacterized protein n=1 Tax=Eleusine coracana subsp. coracana TaxID=191504 RepID=A0AAV5F0U8_ELECO|nr:hypothetical protein PR202_gb16674 [Eleusine coracana subsp. coracana]
MAAALLFHDLGLLADDSTSSSCRLLLSARALELGYAAVALDHPHRGLLANSHRCSTQPIAPLSSLPLPPSAALHRRRLASPTSEPFRQLTRITLSIDSPAAAASALAPSAARLLRTYDIVAARPLNQAAFDHLCQVPYSQQLDLVSIDFSHKLPFRLKLPMLKLALQRGLHFEIAYSSFLATDRDKCILADAKLLADWTKGKNLIISSAACTATQIRGPYDAINLCSYLLGLPMNRAKAAISTNPRSLILKALRKKHFYKETIRIERLLPHKKLDSTKFMLGDWIGWDSESCKGDLHASETNQLEPSSNKDQRPNSPIYGVIQVSHHKPDVSVISKPSEQPTIDEEIPSQAQDETVQADIVMDHGLPVLPVSFDHQDTGPYKPANHEDVMDHFVQAVSDPSVDLKSDGKHAEFDLYAMKVDATESCRLNIIAGSNVSSISETCIKLVHSTLHQGLGHSGTSLEDMSLGKTTEILCDARSNVQYQIDCVSNEAEKEKTSLAHEFSSRSDVCFKDMDVDQSIDIPVDTEADSGTSEPVECPPGGKDDKEPTDRSIDEGIEQIAEGEVESTYLKNRNDISVEPLFQGQDISSAGYMYPKNSADANCENDELKEQTSEETIASLQKNTADTHEQSLNYPYPISKVEIITVKSGKILAANC